MGYELGTIRSSKSDRSIRYDRSPSEDVGDVSMEGVKVSVIFILMLLLRLTVIRLRWSNFSFWINHDFLVFSI